MKNVKLNLNKDGSFKVENVDKLSYLYFPLANYASIKSSITPSLNGDSKIDQNSFLLLPNSSEDLHNSFMNRNMYFRVNDEFTWSVTGNTPYQMINKDEVSMEADFLIHKILRENNLFSCEIESFVPFNDTYQELHKVKITNKKSTPLKIKPIVNVPIYSRSADNLRDHRHVTALLNKVTIVESGVLNKPTFSFDERGHILNDKHYGVFVCNSLNMKPVKYWPVLEEFIGEGGSLLDPIVCKSEIDNNYKVGDIVSGYEVAGGFEYDKITLEPNESFELCMSILADDSLERAMNIKETLSLEYYTKLKNETKEKWEKELQSLTFTYGDDNYNGWLKWITIQPILRRIYGCSFLPHHDYGRGGRGWRDLWQDCLALILMDPTDVRNLLSNNFIGVRIDGSNATIIGEKPGEFLADRNNIPRVWMDHGSWPLITTKLYVDKSGDYEFLLQEQKYFSDKFSHYTKKITEDFVSEDNYLRDKDNKLYQGSILEHLIIQNLVPFYNVGKMGNLRLEDADWNDALDMAHTNGESVAFTTLYASNLITISQILDGLISKGVNELNLLKELRILLDDVDFSSISDKKECLNKYFDEVASISGDKVTYNIKELSEKLLVRGEYLLTYVRNNEWLEGEKGSWFNSYYDDDLKRLDDADLGNMTLTGQVFSIYSGAATDEQIEQIVESADKYLYEPKVGGYRLNTDFNELKTNMGRLFGFAYGHKENGAMFSHMAVMYANALYKRGFVKSGNLVLKTIYNHCSDISKSKIYPGIPEYIDPKGRGMYHYLTGSASWYILTEVTEVFGVKGDFGELVLEPKLLKEQFDNNGIAKINTLVSGRSTEIEYVNKKLLEFGDYRIKDVIADTTILKTIDTKFGVKVLNLPNVSKIKVILDE